MASQPMGKSPLPRTTAGFGATLVLTITFAFASFLLLMAAIWVVHPPHKLPGFFAAGGDQNQGTKTFLYVFAYAAILPLAVIAVPRLADAIAAGPSGEGLPALASLLSGSLALALLFVKLSTAFPWGDGTGVVLVAVGVWALGATLLLRRLMRAPAWPPLLSLARCSAWLWAAVGVLLFGLVLSVTAVHSLSVLP